MKVFNAGWYLIYTKPRHEKKVHAYLSERQINSFLPTAKKMRMWHDRKKIIDEPLFPSYLFIYLNEMQHYYDGLDAEGALYYVRTGKEIARVQDTVIDSIRVAIGSAKEIEVSDQRFLPGRRLVIGKGALTGLSCEVVQYNGREKLLVRVDLLQRNILVTVPEDNLVAI
jgi:transcriptional antiterminator RfaH